MSYQVTTLFYRNSRPTVLYKHDHIACISDERSQPDKTRGNKLHTVSTKVEDDLAQPQPVTHDHHVLGAVDFHFELFPPLV